MAPLLIQSVEYFRALSLNSRPPVNPKTPCCRPERPIRLSRAQKPQSVRAIKGKDPTSTSPRNLEASPELTARLADRSSVASVRSSVSPSDETAVSSGMPTATANHVLGNSGGPALRPKAKRRVQIPIALDASPAAVSAKDQGSITRTDSLGALPTAVDDVSRPNRKRTIMGRYVFGDEPKPGERWKRRLSKGRVKPRQRNAQKRLFRGRRWRTGKFRFWL